MTAARTKKTKTTLKAGPAAQWRGRVEAADWTTSAPGSIPLRGSLHTSRGLPRVSRRVCLHWLPYWLPKIYLPSLIFKYTKTVSIKSCSYRLIHEPSHPAVTLCHRHPRQPARVPDLA
jgi:hypothetical protein